MIGGISLSLLRYLAVISRVSTIESSTERFVSVTVFQSRKYFCVKDLIFCCWF